MEMEREMDCSGSGDGAKEDDSEIEREAEREWEAFQEFRRKKYMDRYGSGDGVVSEENQSSYSGVELVKVKAEDVETDSEDEDYWYGLYERDPSCKEGPPQELKDYAQLAIATYNKRKNQHYIVVDIIRSQNYALMGFVVFMSFTAKLPDQDDADAITFRTEIWVNYVWDSTTVEFVGIEFIGPLTEEETTTLRGGDAYG